MTNAIEQSKREMYKDLTRVGTMVGTTHLFKAFEESLESYLELLRQDHEALHETARKRFEDLQVAEEANQELIQKLETSKEIATGSARYAHTTISDLESRLAKMTEERDAIQLRLHAVDHSYNEQQRRGATLVSNSGENVASAIQDGKTNAIQGASADIRKISDAWAMTGRRAKKSMLKISGILARPEVYAAMEAIEKPATCMHSFFAIGQDQMKCTYCSVEKEMPVCVR